MSTASTKSNRDRRARSQGSNARTAKGKQVPEPKRAEPISNFAWLISAIAILGVGAFLRLYDLQLVPLHHDEGVNGNFLVRLVREGFYRYDPENYHGPTLYYFAAVIPKMIGFIFGTNAQNAYGLTTFNIRLVTALFGLATIWLVLLLRNQLGRVGTLAAAALLAVSPGAVYLSRYFIHESLFVFFTLAIIVAAVKYYESANPVYLILLASSAGLLFATKETWIISVGVLLIALLSTHAYQLLLGNSGSFSRKRGATVTGALSEWSERTISRLGGPIPLAISLLTALAVFVVVGVLFYSSFTTNWNGVNDSLKTFAIWSKTGKTAHVHEWWTYLKWLLEEEAPLLALGAAGVVIAALKPKNSFSLFSALWAVGILAAYSFVPYKTPWLALNFIVPLAIVAGSAFQAIYDFGGEQILQPLAVIAALAIGVAGYQMFVLNFLKYDDDHYAYVYAHSRRDLLKLVADIDAIAQHTKKPNETGITIVSPEYWPLPWYFRDYQRVGYYARMSSSTEPIIIAREDQRAEAEANFGSRYRQVQSGLNPDGTFSLRPGVELLLYVRRDVAGP